MVVRAIRKRNSIESLLHDLFQVGQFVSSATTIRCFSVSEKVGDVEIFNLTSMDVLPDLEIRSIVVSFLTSVILGIFFSIFPEDG